LVGGDTPENSRVFTTSHLPRKVADPLACARKRDTRKMRNPTSGRRTLHSREARGKLFRERPRVEGGTGESHLAETTDGKDLVKKVLCWAKGELAVESFRGPFDLEKGGKGLKVKEKRGGFPDERLPMSKIVVKRPNPMVRPKEKKGCHLSGGPLPLHEVGSLEFRRWGKEGGLGGGGGVKRARNSLESGRGCRQLEKTPLRRERRVYYSKQRWQSRNFGVQRS